MENMAIEANELGVHTRQGWVFRNVNLSAPAGSLAGIAGPAGSGRSALLLTIAGRMRLTEGTLSVCGLTLPPQAHEVRSRVAVARVADIIAPEPELRVRDHVIERELLAGRTIDEPDQAFHDACDLMEFAPEPGAIVEELDPADVTLLAVALALMDRPEMIILDDLDVGVASAVQTQLWRRLRAVAGSGTTILASTTDPLPCQGQLDAYVELDLVDAGEAPTGRHAQAVADKPT